ncbi:hypothetical protein ACFLZW_06090 [Chloroflexota bacterium]
MSRIGKLTFGNKIAQVLYARVPGERFMNITDLARDDYVILNTLKKGDEAILYRERGGYVKIKIAYKKVSSLRVFILAMPEGSIEDLDTAELTPIDD